MSRDIMSINVLETTKRPRHQFRYSSQLISVISILTVFAVPAVVANDAFAEIRDAAIRATSSVKTGSVCTVNQVCNHMHNYYLTYLRNAAVCIYPTQHVTVRWQICSQAPANNSTSLSYKRETTHLYGDHVLSLITVTQANYTCIKDRWFNIYNNIICGCWQTITLWARINFSQLCRIAGILLVSDLWTNVTI